MRNELNFLLQFPVDWLVKIAMAFVCGSIIGLEREIHRKAAGIRTNVMICMGATIFTLAGELITIMAGSSAGMDLTRIPGQIIVGMGFIGAGTIMQAKGQVTGLTSAATMWVMAGIGVIIGIGFPLLGLIITILVLFLLVVLGKGVHLFLGKCKMTRVTLSFRDLPETWSQLEDIFSVHGKKIESFPCKRGNSICFLELDYCTVHPEHSELLLDTLKVADVRKAASFH